MNTSLFLSEAMHSKEIDVPKKETSNVNEYTTTTTNPSWFTVASQQPPNLSSLSLLSSSPTDVVLSSSSSTFQHLQLQQHHHHHQLTDRNNALQKSRKCNDRQVASSLLLQIPQSSSTTSDLDSTTTSTTKVVDDENPLPPIAIYHAGVTLHESLGNSNPWPIFAMSEKAQRTHNPIRAMLDTILSSKNNCSSNTHAACCGGSVKVQISLALGDPIAAASPIESMPELSDGTAQSTTVTAGTPVETSLRPCPHAIRAVVNNLMQENNTATTSASYANAIGTVEGRRAIAQYHSHPFYTYNPDDDVVIANGCSGALEILLNSLLDSNCHERSILLVPSPGFPLYRVIAESHGAAVISYPLLPHQQWEIDLVQLQTIIAETLQVANTTIRGMVVNNPSNPTGAVYSCHHLKQIISTCQQYYIPIIADEIYGDMIFPSCGSNRNDTKFIPMAQIAAQMGQVVPIITASGIAKQFLLPGWRIGWICFQDNIYGSLQHVKDGTKRLAQIVLGASHLAQIAIPALLLAPPTEDSTLDSISRITDYRKSYDELLEWKNNVRITLYGQSKVLCSALQQIGPCLHVIEPQGAMYAMVRINLDYFHRATIRNDIDFTTLLYQEENIVVLPGTCFDFPNSFRVVFCSPSNVLIEAANRIRRFCHRHEKSREEKFRSV